MSSATPTAAPTARVRPADVDNPADVAALAMLRYAWRVSESGESGEPAAFATAFGAWWHEHRASHRAWLAERDAEPIGMTWLAMIERIPGPGHFRRLAGIVQSVYVVPGERGSGTGAQLIRAAVGQARADGFDYLMVHPSPLSYGLYRRVGFADTGRALELGLNEPRGPNEVPPRPD